MFWSAGWYRKVLELDYGRELGGTTPSPGALADWLTRNLIAPRLRNATAGRADLRGEHPVVIETADATAAERMRVTAA